MNASDADRPESNENVPEPPVPSEPSDASKTASGPAASGSARDEGTESANAESANADSERSEPEESEPEEGMAAQTPAPLRPAEGQTVDEPSVTFEWEGVEQADNYQLQIAKDREFTELVFDARVGSSSAFTYSGLPPQEGYTLYWRVRAHIQKEETWTEFGTVGTFVLADWRPEQPALAEAQAASAPVADADIGDSSRAEPVLITFSILVTVAAVGLSILYMQDGGLSMSAEEPDGMETADADTTSLDLEAPVPNEDGETYRISINDAMRQVVRERGGTWDESPPRGGTEGTPGEMAQQAEAQQEPTPQAAEQQPDATGTENMP